MKNAKRSFIIGIILSLFFNITISYAEGYNPGDSFQIITDGAYKYSYAPSSIYDWPYEYHYYCGNSVDNQVKDHVYLKKYNVTTNTWTAR